MMKIQKQSFFCYCIRHEINQPYDEILDFLKKKIKEQFPFSDPKKYIEDNIIDFGEMHYLPPCMQHINIDLRYEKDLLEINNIGDKLQKKIENAKSNEESEYFNNEIETFSEIKKEIIANNKNFFGLNIRYILHDNYTFENFMELIEKQNSFLKIMQNIEEVFEKSEFKISICSKFVFSEEDYTLYPELQFFKRTEFSDKFKSNFGETQINQINLKMENSPLGIEKMILSGSKSKFAIEIASSYKDRTISDLISKFQTHAQLYRPFIMELK